MATLGQIRNHTKLLLVVIGVGMLAFIGGDFMSSLGSGGGGGIYVGEVLGEDVLRQDYEVKVEEGINNWKSQNQQSILTQTVTGQIRSQVWDQYVRELVMNNEYAKLGIDVSDDEFFELLQGMNVHPEISKIPTFQDQATGQFDRTKLIGYLKQIDQDQTGEARTRWLGFEKYLIGLIKTSKYNSLVAKAMHVTNEEAKIYFNEKSQNITFNYVAIPLTSVADSTVEPTESEIETYYINHKSNYEQNASKDVDFVAFSVIPSTEDDAITKSSIEDLKADFAIYEDYDLMARRNSDNTTARFTFATKKELQDPNWAELFTAEEGAVIGPYQASQGVYRIAKLAIAQNRPDSVEARHILIKPTESMNLDSVQTRIDAIKAQVEAGADFGVLAEKNSEDKGSAIKGGDLGWFSEGAMVDEFNEACFTSKRGGLSVVTSQFGVHLIEVTKTSKAVRKVKVAFIDRNVEPSTETFNTYYSQAAQFAGKILNEGIAFDSLVVEQNLVKRSDSKVTADKQSIVGLPNSREMVRWMNTSEQGKVSEVFQFENSYVVAYLKKTYAEGDTPLEDIKEQISALVLKEKKVAYISANIKVTDLATIATNYGQVVISAQSANLSNLSLQGIGYEPELVGSIFAINVGAISNPIEGKNAVYVIEVTAKDDEKTSGDFTQQKQEIQKGTAAYSNGAAYKALNTEADVKDNRSDFY
jgi:peptidyl-prolyl cis-trans isomerase D